MITRPTCGRKRARDIGRWAPQAICDLNCSFHLNGEMSEWLKEHAWKACVGETLPRVRIPLSPPNSAFAPCNGRRRSSPYQRTQLTLTSGTESLVLRSVDGCRLPRFAQAVTDDSRAS